MGRSLVVGVDIGGTNTDGVLIQNNKVLHSVKVPTADDIGSGVISAFRQLLHNRNKDDVCRIALGTTQFINALTGIVKSLEKLWCLPCHSLYHIPSRCNLFIPLVLRFLELVPPLNF